MDFSSLEPFLRFALLTYLASAILVLAHVTFVLYDWKRAVRPSGDQEFHWIAALCLMLPDRLNQDRYLYSAPTHRDAVVLLGTAFAPILNTVLLGNLTVMLGAGCIRRLFVLAIWGTELKRERWMKARF